MSALLENELPGRMQKILRLVSREADTMNLKVYLVGGIIRDLLLRRPPSKDLDFVVIGDALAFASRLHELLGGSLKQFDKFGTASLLLGDGLRLDLVTARREFYASPASLPDVESSSLKNDLYRRDFTINTMACALSIEGYGRFYDYYNGEKDLQNALIRVLYKLSFVDDPLRILRAVRFEKRYSFNIERETLTLMQRAIGRGLVNRVSRQRLNHELKLFYSEESPAGILKHSDELGLLPQLYPGLSAKEETWKLLFRLEKVLPGLAENDKGIRPDRELTYLAGLLYYLESEERSAIINKLGFSREREVVITEVCAKLPGILNKLEADDLKHSAVAGTLRSLPAEGLTLAAALAENKTVRSYLELYMKNLRFLRPRIGGGDLKKLGLEPGPLYQEIIEKLKEAVIDGEVRTPREELDYVIAYLEKRNR